MTPDLPPPNTPRIANLATSLICMFGTRAPKRLLRVTSIGVGVTSGVYLYDKYYQSSVLTRSARAISVLLIIGYKYYYTTDLPLTHETCSEMLLNLLLKNKGLYIKIGQSIANQGDIFPETYKMRFKRLYEFAPIDESGKSIEDVLSKIEFADFDHTPTGTGSIAQVHRATLPSGEDVAVKIQHSYIKNQINADLFIYRLVSKVYERVFNIPLVFFSHYVSQELTKETNFTIEAENSKRCAEMCQNLNVYVPKVFDEYTSSTILVTEWVDGISLSDKEAVIDSGYNVNSLLHDYLKILSRMTFSFGFVHADPHPGNLKITKINGKQTLVLLDHGLYTTLTPKFKREYALLWEYIFSLDYKGIKLIGEEWGINSIDLFASLVSLRPIKLEGMFKKKSKSAEVKIANGKDNASNNISSGISSIDDNRDINDLLSNFIADELKFPLELLFLTRNMRMMQNLNKEYGSPVNRLNLITKESVKSLSLEVKGTRQNLKLFLIKSSLFFNDIFFYLVRFRQVLLGDKYGGKGVGIEDYLEVYMKNTAKSIGLNV